VLLTLAWWTRNLLFTIVKSCLSHCPFACWPNCCCCCRRVVICHWGVSGCSIHGIASTVVRKWGMWVEKGNGYITHGLQSANTVSISQSVIMDGVLMNKRIRSSWSPSSSSRWCRGADNDETWSTSNARLLRTVDLHSTQSTISSITCCRQWTIFLIRATFLRITWHTAT